jgi:uncharacterized phage protein (TIGR02218 family)
MRTVPAGLTTHLAQRATRLAVCWKIVRADSTLILGTEHDRNIVIASGTYEGTYVARAGITGSNVASSSDLAVDNLEVTGAINPADLSIVDLSAADIEAGLFDDADVTLFLVNWEDPSEQLVLRKGTIGSITRTSDGGYKTELRGLTQALSQTIVRTYSVTCDAELGDARCGVNMAAFTFAGTVDTVTDRRTFTATITGAPADALITGGKVTWSTGDNAGYSMEVKSKAGTTVNLFLPMPVDISVGDTFNVYAGCDKSKATCIATFSNLVNFRGHGVFVPGETEVLKIGGQ